MIVGYLSMVTQIKRAMDAAESKNLYPDKD